MTHPQSKFRGSKAAAAIRIVCLLVITALIGQAVPLPAYGFAPLASVLQDTVMPEPSLTYAATTPEAAAPQGVAKPRFSISWTATSTGHYENTSGGAKTVIDDQARMAGFGVWQEPEGQPSDGFNQPFSVTYTDEYNNTVTSDCPWGGSNLTYDRFTLIDPERYSSGPDYYPKLRLWQRSDGTWYIPDPFSTGLFWCSGASCSTFRNYTYRHEHRYQYCDVINSSTWYNEDRGTLSTVPTPGDLDPDASGTTFHKHVELIQPGATYSRTVVWDVTVRLLSARDLTVERLEVNQGLQDVANTIPLARGRRTVVRAYLGIGGDLDPVPNVSGVLRAYSGGTLLGEVRPFNPRGVITAKPSPDWQQIDDTLNFELPYAWTLHGDLHLEVEVNPSHNLYETNFTNNQRAEDIAFRACNPLSIAYTPIHYDPPGGYNPPYPDGDIVKGHEFLRKVYPVADLGLKYNAWPIMTWTEIMHTGTTTDTDQASADLAKRLEDDYSFGLSQSDPATYPDRLVGWMPQGGGGPLNGEADGIPGVAAWVGENKNPNYWRATFAHEIGHTYGLYHNSLTTRGRHWFDVYDRVIKPGATSLGGVDLYDFIHTPGLPEPERWVSPESYNHLLDELCPPPIMAASTSAAPIRAQTTTTDTLMVTGVISLSTTGGSLGPIYQLPPGNTLIPPAGNMYCLNLKGGTTLLNQYCFNSDAELEATTPLTPTHLPFDVIVPYPAGLNRIDLTKGASGPLLASRVASAHPPTVTLQFPVTAGLTLTGPQTLQWTASYLDGDPLTYAILYSADGGANWISLGSGIHGTTTYPIDFSTLPGGSQALIKVLASDGFRSAEDTSDNTFTVANKPPAAAITSPSAGARFNTGSAVTLEGLGTDLEDGSMADSALHWSSNIDGALGTGRLREVILSRGVHTITLTAQDGGGLTATDTITVAVLSPDDWLPYRVYLPMIKRP